MAVPKENSLSLGHLSSTGRDTLTKQRDRSGKNSTNKPWGLSTAVVTSDSHHYLRVMHLQQRLQELKEREHLAQQRNRQLLHQFDEAQHTLKEMMASNAAMKTIRMEYERYLQENGPHWQQQFEEQRWRAHEKRMKTHLKSDLNSSKMTKSADVSSNSQETATFQGHSDYNRNLWPSHTQSQLAAPPPKSPYELSSHVPPSLLPPSGSLPLHNFTPAIDHHKPWQDPAGWASLQADQPWSWVASLAGLSPASQSSVRHLHPEEPPPNEVREDAESSRASSSRRGRCDESRSKLSSQELDVKPVRLSSGPADSSESGRDSYLSSSDRKKKRRGKSLQSPPSEHHSAQEVSTSSQAPPKAPVREARSSESDVSSDIGHNNERSRRMQTSGDESKKSRKNAQSPSEESEQEEEEKEEEVVSERSSEREESPIPDVEEEEEESRGESLNNQSGAAGGAEKESSSSEEERKKTEEAREEDEIKMEKDFVGENTTEDETEAEDENGSDSQEDDEDPKNGKLGAASSEDEAEDESDEDEEGSEEEQKEEPIEDEDSDDSIISPQEKRPKQMQVILEEAAVDDGEEEEEESNEESSDEDSNGCSDEDIENLLAPQEPKEDEQQESEDERSEIRNKVMIFQVQQNSPKSQQRNDSDESDHFYD